jgi:ketosteroid isomerase-like protein
MPPAAAPPAAPSTANLETALAYLRAIAGGAAEDFAAYCTDDVEFIELPNRISPHGSRRDRAAALASAHRGRTLMAAQTYDVVSTLTDGDRVALEVAWSGTLAIQLQHLTPGSVLTAHLSLFLDFRDGKICRQRNYDCYPPF